jgi:hypothetical protein
MGDVLDELEKLKVAAENLPSAKERERKIRFPDSGVATHNIRHPEDFDAEHLSLARALLNARGDELPRSFEERFQSEVKKYTMTTTDTGTGLELVPVAPFPKLLRDVHLATNVASLFPLINMDSIKMELSECGDAVFYKPGGEGVAVSATDLATAKRTLQAFTVKAQVDVSDELDATAIVALIPAIRQVLLENAAAAMDDVIVNADTTTGKLNINYYKSDGEDIPASSVYLLGFDGLFHLPLVENTNQKSDLGTLEVADFATLLSLMEKYGIDPGQVAFVLDLWSYVKAVQLSDVKTVDKIGAKATLLTGQLASIFGAPIIVSEQIKKSDANGVVSQTPADNVKGRIIAVNRMMWRVGVLTPVQVRSQRDESKGLTSLVANVRVGLVAFGDRASAKHVAVGYNVTI